MNKFIRLANFGLPASLLIEYSQSVLNESPMTQPLPVVQSPCIRNCCLDDKDMCLGCFRMLDEILIWSTASTARQLDIVQACGARKQKKAQGDLG